MARKTTARKTTVTHPDGTVSQRSSKTMVYSFAVEVTIDRRAAAATLRTRATGYRALHAEATRIVATGDLTVLTRKVTAHNGLGERFYSSYVPGDFPQHPLPDYRDTESWTKWIDRTLDDMIVRADRLDAEAAGLEQGAEFEYGVYRWSQTRPNAEKGLTEFAKYAAAGSTARVVAVDAA